ncbi:hypothetical protein ALP92_102713 [Pseudomonas syringae pv. primulae]|uniref:Uncharacterized protein n=1 Tax=Pseudomonas syringae pv. primulae TaxID=251707 RepID=A0A3M4SDT0_9PSED|nr:hypothetical protein ALP92_102713 [Pseudomonas syringae pv. primulae]
MFKNSPRVYRSDARTGLRMPLLLVGVQLEPVAVLDSGLEWTKKRGEAVRAALSFEHLSGVKQTRKLVAQPRAKQGFCYYLIECIYEFIDGAD